MRKREYWKDLFLAFAFGTALIEFNYTKYLIMGFIPNYVPLIFFSLWAIGRVFGFILDVIRFTQKENKKTTTNVKKTNETVDHIKRQLDDYENLSSHEYERLILMINSLKKENSGE